jgi:hypothetical protein
MSDPNRFAAPFEAMAERVRRNLPEDFAGAILVVPAEGEPIAMLIADPSRDQEAFWSTALSKVQIRFEQLRATNPHGRR